ncbi:phage tail protein [Gloeomargarita lithophora Alchichica-D10]|uniref:Phage tail protein n=1 Tax=Gloeomargarita lithophora Alchichica-D10 TaxID=1188229 RepID=A0A1J0AE86_9CYAN|nr:phage tail protein [Gloeomargarita lithophora]APB34211.1 phage tail protein [Gloeomargarita lithophora Alchichica-D10]
MTFTPDTATLQLRLAPMVGALTPFQSQGYGRELAAVPLVEPRRQATLVVAAGALQELALQLEYRGSAPLELGVSLVGEVPRGWCFLLGAEGVLAPGERRPVSLVVAVPGNFWEDQQALRPGTSLVLDFSGVLHIYGRLPEQEWRLLEVLPLELSVRPPARYLDFLPKIYRQSDFLGRLLAIFEQTFEPDVQMLDGLWAYLDPRTAPVSWLPFLSHWVGWRSPLRLEVQVLRQLIYNAFSLYQWRGTRRGLRLFLHLATGLPLDEQESEEYRKHIGIQEFFQRGLILGEAVVGETAVLGAGRPYHFRVWLRADAPERVDVDLVRAVIDQEKPAFCTYDLEITSWQEGGNGAS